MDFSPTSSPPPLRPRLTIPSNPTSPEENTYAYVPPHDLRSPAMPVDTSLTTPLSSLLLSPAAMPAPNIHPIYESKSGSWTYLVADPVTEEGVIVNPILNFDPQSNKISTPLADALLATIESEGYLINYILETGIHRNHISSCRYVCDKLISTGSQPTPKVCIGRNLDKIRGDLSPETTSPDRRASVDNSAFDKLFADSEKFRIGNIVGEVIYLSTISNGNTDSIPSSSPSSSSTTTEHVGYVFGPNIFVNIPEGVHSLSEGSRKRLFLNHPPDARIYGITPTGTPPRLSPPQPFTTIAQLQSPSRNQTSSPTPSTSSWCSCSDKGDATAPTSSTAAAAAPSSKHVVPSLTHFYATQINSRAGRIPQKINLMAPPALPSANGEVDTDADAARRRRDSKQKEAMPRPLLIPKKLQGLLC